MRTLGEIAILKKSLFAPIMHYVKRECVKLAVDENTNRPQDMVKALLYLYSVVMALALTTAVSSTVAPEGKALSLSDLSASNLAIFGTIFITLVPFYHGASLHMLRTYRNNSKTRKKGEALTDFFALALEAVIFYAMAKSLTQLQSFLIWFGALLVLDTGWVAFTYFKSQTEIGQAPKWWAVLNIGMILVLILLWGSARTGETQIYAILFVSALIRTLVDYWKCYNFYFPGEGIKQTS
jgi:hypothetical protein